MTLTNSKRLAKNTILMYIRMLFLLCISFYTSRVILQQLGVEDYGIYNVVGSVVAMFSSLKSIFSMSTQRFLNYEMGANNGDNLNTIYCTSIFVNIFISIIFIIIVEIIGLWFLNTSINVPQDRFVAANWVFHLSVFTTVITIINTTFDAEIIAHEKMNFYAYLSIFEGFAKLFIVYLLSISALDKLIFYGLLHFGVILLVAIINSLYCRRNFVECHLNFRFEKAYLKRMTSFAGWNFFGTNAYVFAQNGMNMVLNVFGGPAVNAARGIAYQINAAVMQFINNIVIVVNPFCVKTYASGAHKKAANAIILASKVLFTVQFCISVPMLFLTGFLLGLWLDEVPDYSIDFVRLIIVYSIIRSVHPSMDIWFKSVGDIKYYQIFEGIFLLLPVGVSYLALRHGMSFNWTFIIMSAFEVVNLIGITIIAKHISDFPISDYYRRTLLPCLSMGVIGILFFLLADNVNFNSILNLCFLMVVCIIVSLCFMFFIGLNRDEKVLITNLIKRK